MDTVTHTAEQALPRLRAFFEGLQPTDTERMGQCYAPDAVFKDPFNEVQGPAAIGRIFGHMYTVMHEPHFVVTGQIAQGDEAFLRWEFRFRFKRFSPDTPQTIHGASHLRFNAQGQVTLHRDYWDAAEELYEKLPAVGALMRWLKRRANS